MYIFALILGIFSWMSSATLAAPPAAPLAPLTFNTQAQQVLLMDAHTGAILLEKNGGQTMYPSSMTKIMTVYMAFEKLKSGELTLENTLPISKKAWKKGGSRMFVEVGSQVRLEDLLRGIIVQSGNDASIALAEGLSGSEEAFAAEMTQRAHDFGATQTTFKNATGWPDENHVTTARDLAVIAKRLIDDFPEFYAMFSETEFTYNKISQPNRNPLLYRNVNADGLKTGSTNAGGYGLVASSHQGAQRLILVANGYKNQMVRAQDSETLMRWAQRQFQTVKVFQAGDTVGQANVWLGDKAQIPLVTAQDIIVTLPRRNLREYRVVVEHSEPLEAPIEQGHAVGKLIVRGPEGVPEISTPIYAGATVQPAGFFKRIRSAIYYLVWGHNELPEAPSTPSQT